MFDNVAGFQSTDAFGFGVLIAAVLIVIWLLYVYMLRKNNPYPFYFISKFFDKSIKKVMLFEVEIVGNKPIASFKGYGLFGNKGLYIPEMDMLYEVPTDLFLHGYDSLRLFYRRYGKLGMLPLRVFGVVFNDDKIREIAEKEKIAVGGELAITSVDAKMTLLLTDSYISTFYRRLASISLQTRDSIEGFLKEQAANITIVLVGFLSLVVVAWGISSMYHELAGVCA